MTLDILHLLGSYMPLRRHHKGQCAMCEITFEVDTSKRINCWRDCIYVCAWISNATVPRFTNACSNVVFCCFRQCMMSYLSCNAYCIVRAPDYICHVKCPRLIASCIAHHAAACLSPEQPEAVFPHVIFFFLLRLCMSGITHSSSWHCRRLVWHLQWCCSLRIICAYGHAMFCSLTCLDARCSSCLDYIKCLWFWTLLIL